MRLIDADELVKAHARFFAPSNNSDFENEPTWNDAVSLLESASTVDAIEVVRCKDCIHKPTGSGVNHDITFPEQDYRCPCRCEDYWYSWMPDDDWFCANGERRKQI